jgi:hypothetical protein
VAGSVSAAGGKAGGADVGNAEAVVAITAVKVGAGVAEGVGAAASPLHPVSSKIKTTSKVRFINQSTFQRTQMFIESKSESPNRLSG